MGTKKETKVVEEEIETLTGLSLLDNRMLQNARKACENPKGRGAQAKKDLILMVLNQFREVHQIFFSPGTWDIQITDRFDDLKGEPEFDDALELVNQVIQEEKTWEQALEDAADISEETVEMTQEINKRIVEG